MGNGRAACVLHLVLNKVLPPPVELPASYVALVDAGIDALNDLEEATWILLFCWIGVRVRSGPVAGKTSREEAIYRLIRQLRKEYSAEADKRLRTFLENDIKEML